MKFSIFALVASAALVIASPVSTDTKAVRRSLPLSSRDIDAASSGLEARCYCTTSMCVCPDESRRSLDTRSGDDYEYDRRCVCTPDECLCGGPQPGSVEVDKRCLCNEHVCSCGPNPNTVETRSDDDLFKRCLCNEYVCSCGPNPNTKETREVESLVERCVCTPDECACGGPNPGAHIARAPEKTLENTQHCVCRGGQCICSNKREPGGGCTCHGDTCICG